MKEPTHRPSPAFEQARDKQSAWREKQKTLLSDDRRERYEAIRQEGFEKQKEKADELEASRQRRTDEEKRRLLLDHPDLALRMLPLPPVKDYFANRRARHTIELRDAAELRRFEYQEQERADKFLQDVEAQRQQQTLSRYFSERARDDDGRHY